MIPSKRHGILNEDVGGTQDLVVSLISTLASPLTPEIPPRTTILPKIGATVTSAVVALLRRYGKRTRGANPI
jgi:hypothetical protein